jgi:acyl-CoA hydrolase
MSSNLCRFLAPVEIGNLLTFTGEVVYSDDSVVQVSVAADVVNPGMKLSDRSVTTNVFHFTFSTGNPITKKVIPYSYEDSLRFVDGRRRAMKLHHV